MSTKNNQHISHFGRYISKIIGVAHGQLFLTIAHPKESPKLLIISINIIASLLDLRCEWDKII